jgi:Spy/CpxP family protein refolding chaperone
MTKSMFFKSSILLLCLAIVSSISLAQGIRGKGDVFKGKLFPPKIILEHQDTLGLTKNQFKAIKAAVVEVQTNVAEHEWDMREAYRRVLAELDETPIDEGKALENIRTVLQAENQVKLAQVTMLIRIRNLLTDEQIEYLRKQQRN